jgi:hypothetical protein
VSPRNKIETKIGALQRCHRSCRDVLHGSSIPSLNVLSRSLHHKPSTWVAQRGHPQPSLQYALTCGLLGLAEDRLPLITAAKPWSGFLLPGDRNNLQPLLLRRASAATCGYTLAAVAWLVIASFAAEGG